MRSSHSEASSLFRGVAGERPNVARAGAHQLFWGRWPRAAGRLEGVDPLAEGIPLRPIPCLLQLQGVDPPRQLCDLFLQPRQLRLHEHGQRTIGLFYQSERMMFFRPRQLRLDAALTIADFRFRALHHTPYWRGHS